MTKTNPQHYIDNKKFFDAMVAYKESLREAERLGLETPRASEYIGDCIVRIARKLSTSHKFINYSYREEMISDGIENCMSYLDNFNPEKSENPFAYFTQIIYYAFLRRISKEQKNYYTKLREIERFNMNSALMGGEQEVIKSSEGSSETAAIFMENFEKKHDNLRKKV